MDLPFSKVAEHLSVGYRTGKDLEAQLREIRRKCYTVDTIPEDLYSRLWEADRRIAEFIGGYGLEWLAVKLAVWSTWDAILNYNYATTRGIFERLNKDGYFYSYRPNTKRTTSQ